MIAMLILSLGGLAYTKWPEQPAEEAATFFCSNPRVTDGDTLRCGGTRVRLAGIDAPEMPGHCRPGRACAPGDPHASHRSLQSLAEPADLTCRRTDIDVYGRTVARCRAGTTDLSCAQLDGGFAIRRYGLILC